MKQTQSDLVKETGTNNRVYEFNEAKNSMACLLLRSFDYSRFISTTGTEYLVGITLSKLSFKYLSVLLKGNDLVVQVFVTI
jgi:hypothetical protein